MCDFRDLEEYIVSSEDDRIASHYRHFQNVRERNRGNKRPGFYECKICCWSEINRGNWVRHQKQHWPQDIWLCRHDGCLTQPTKSRVFFARHRLMDHHERHHRKPGDSEMTQQEADRCCIVVRDSEFPKICDYGCSVNFETFDQRLEHLPVHFDKAKHKPPGKGDKSPTDTDSGDSNDPGFDDNIRPGSSGVRRGGAGSSKTQAPNVSGPSSNLQTEDGNRHVNFNSGPHYGGLRFRAGMSRSEVRTRQLKGTVDFRSPVVGIDLPKSASQKRLRAPETRTAPLQETMDSPPLISSVDTPKDGSPKQPIEPMKHASPLQKELAAMELLWLDKQSTPRSLTRHPAEHWSSRLRPAPLSQAHLISKYGYDEKSYAGIAGVPNRDQKSPCMQRWLAESPYKSLEFLLPGMKYDLERKHKTELMFTMLDNHVSDTGTPSVHRGLSNSSDRCSLGRVQEAESYQRPAEHKRLDQMTTQPVLTYQKLPSM